MSEFDIKSYIKKCKIYLSCCYRYLLVVMIICLIVGLISIPVKWKPHLLNGLMALGIVFFILKAYVQYIVLICPYCNKPFSESKGMPILPYKCKHCGRVIDPTAPNV